MAVSTSRPDAPSGAVPRTYFSIWQRLLRGYAPLAVFAVLLVLMSLLVPSKSPEQLSAAATGIGTSGGGATGSRTGTTGASGTGDGATAAQPGGPVPADASGTGDPNAAPAVGAGASTCEGDQIPGDPYSPPCMAFEGDNGGETSTGVTGTEIRVSFRVLDEKGFQQTLAELAGATLTDTPADIRRTVEALAEYFNNTFQFYGRRLVIDFYEGVGSNTQELLGKGRDRAEADAETVGSMGVFADLSATSEPYADALARRGVVGFGTPYLSRAWHDQRGPFMWSLATNGTEVAEFASEFAAKRLAGGNADYAGGGLQGRPRIIATMAPENSWYQESVQAARARFEAISGQPSGPNYQYVLDLGTMSNQAANLVPRLKADGVTTIVCGCDPVFPVFLSGAAAREGYFPEFIIAGTALTDADIVGQLWDQQFAANAFGISSLAPQVPPQETIAYEAFKLVRPDQEPAFSVDLIYFQMYMLAIGVQMAGPNLTPETFRDGMYAYPPRGGNNEGPLGLWDFGPGDHTAADDVREIYWDPDAVSPYNGRQGSYIGLNGNARYGVDQLPTGPFVRPS